jgi:hypothetical protein
MKSTGAEFVYGVLALAYGAALSFVVACGSTEQGACVWDDICSQGSSYEGTAGESLCASNGGTWADDGCPMNDQCLGKCSHGSYWVYYYLPEYPQMSDAAADCTYADSSATWEAGCGGKIPTQLDWLSASCSELAGIATPTGACFVECGAIGCSATGVSCNVAPGLYSFCYVETCSVDADCGASGWYCRGGYCSLTCTTVTSGQSSDCPSGWKCYAPDYGSDRRPYCAYGTDGGGDNCGGCGTDNAGGCCGGVFCSGACTGTPCC